MKPTQELIDRMTEIEREFFLMAEGQRVPEGRTVAVELPSACWALLDRSSEGPPEMIVEKLLLQNILNTVHDVLGKNRAMIWRFDQALPRLSKKEFKALILEAKSRPPETRQVTFLLPHGHWALLEGVAERGFMGVEKKVSSFVAGCLLDLMEKRVGSERA